MNDGEGIMARFLVPCLAMFVGVAIGAFALQELHAQTKTKAYSVTEIEVLDPPATAEFRRFLNTAGGKVIGIMGAAPPQRVALTEWDSAEQARAFYMSKAWTDLSPARDKAEKLTRVYSVEVTN